MDFDDRFRQAITKETDEEIKMRRWKRLLAEAEERYLVEQEVRRKHGGNVITINIVVQPGAEPVVTTSQAPAGNGGAANVEIGNVNGATIGKGEGYIGQ